MHTFDLAPLADKSAILNAFKGKLVSELPTPSFIVDRNVVRDNCTRMMQSVSRLGLSFRAHVKTHKTIEGTRMQTNSGGHETDRIVVSTLNELYGLMPLVEDGSITDVLFSLPVVPSKLEELAELSVKVPHFRIMLDHPSQLDILQQYNELHNRSVKWSVFIKIDMGSQRAGFTCNSDMFLETLEKAFLTDTEKHVSIYGFYAHAGHSYGSKSIENANDILLQEIKSVNEAAKTAKTICPSATFTLSVGATPTAHSSSILDLNQLGELFGDVELHAGNYPFCDLQQLATQCIEEKNIACKVLAEVISTYPGRGDISPGEQLVNAGVIALARVFGPIAGHGLVVGQKWYVGRLSQEHGILVPSSSTAELIPLGEKVLIVPQHSCITAASYPWYYVVENDVVVDVWVPFRGW